MTRNIHKTITNRHNHIGIGTQIDTDLQNGIYSKYHLRNEYQSDNPFEDKCLGDK